MQLAKGELQVRCNKWKAGWETESGLMKCLERREITRKARAELSCLSWDNYCSIL